MKLTLVNGRTHCRKDDKYVTYMCPDAFVILHLYNMIITYVLCSSVVINENPMRAYICASIADTTRKRK